MKWVFEAYSNVYKTAMMQDVKYPDHAAIAKERGNGKRSSIFGRFGRH